MSKNILAIDFGTTNSYITFGTPNNQYHDPLHLYGGGTPQIPTEILYSDKAGVDTSVFPIVGKRASETYGDSDYLEIEREQYRFRAVFKPDIGKSVDARKCAVDFLRALLRDAEKNNTPCNPLDHQVIFGVPCEANEEYRENLKQVAREAGFGDISLVEEPKGALLSDLKSGQFSLADMLNGYLVVDFGGGTLDFAFFKNGKIIHWWGDMYCGGKLIDDIFWQWFCEQNPDKVKEYEVCGRDFFYLTHECRELKEWFSDTLTMDPNFNGKRRLGNTGCSIQNLSKAEFERRARNYKPSETFLSFRQKAGLALSPKFERDEPVDIIKWFEETLDYGLREKEIEIRDVHVVSLAGGSSLWYFVKDYCRNKLGIDNKRLLQTPRPFAAISEGLAILPAIQNETVEKKNKIHNDKEGFIKNEIMPAVDKQLVEIQKKIVDEMTFTLFDNEITPLLKEFREKGGTLTSLREKIDKYITDNNRQSLIKKEIETLMTNELTTLYITSFKKINNWLSGFGLQLPKSSKNIHNDYESKEINIPQDSLGLSTIMNLVTGIVTVMSSSVIASICGGGGLALLMAGPGGLIVGFIVGVALIGPLAFYGKSTVEDWISKNLPISPKFLYWTLTDSKIIKLREKTKGKLLGMIGKDIERAKEKIEVDINGMIEGEINKLGILNVTINNCYV